MIKIKQSCVSTLAQYIYIEGSQVIIFKKSVFLSLTIDYVLTNSADPDEMPHNVAFHLGLCCLPKYPFGISGLQRVMGLKHHKICL